MTAFVVLPWIVLFGFVAIYYSEPMLTVQDDGSKVDLIVVPGGDGPPRATQAARLWKAGRAPLILITGDGDCLFNKQIMLRDGVAPSAIFVECQSGSTWQNARLSVPMMREVQAKSALIVTNWYHSRRAIASFRTACPQMHFVASPIGNGELNPKLPTTQADLELIAKEYVKLAWYLLSGHITPAKLTGEQSDGPSSLCAQYERHP